MQVGGVGFNPFSRINFGSRRPFAGNRQRLDSQQKIRNDLRTLLDRTDRLRSALTKLDRAFRSPSLRRVGAILSARAASGTAPPISLYGGPASLTSSEEINTAPTSFGPRGPDFQGLGTSSAEPAISGIYNGSNGTGDLTFRVTRGGTHGVDHLTLDVYAPDNSFIEEIRVNKNDPIATPYLLSNGLVFTLGPGDLIEHDQFTVSVDAGNPTSFTANPVFEGAISTSEATFGGVYDGSSFSGSYRFVVAQGGVRGDDNLEIDVYDTDDVFVETVSIGKHDPVEQVYTLSNGLTLTLGAGRLVDGDEFSLDVFHNVGSSVDPDKAFDGIRNDDPGFDEGFVVTGGTFDINGTTITIAGNDSINSVLAKINASGAGVTASFDALTERIQLTSEEEGPSADIVLENDTTGFFAATKLSDAVLVPGATSDLDKKLILVPALTSVTTGDFSINGVSISVDRIGDTLQDVIDRINQSDAGVTASIDEDGFQIVSNDPQDPLVLADGTSNFLSVVDIAEATFEPTASNAVSRNRATSSHRAVAKSARALERVLNDLFSLDLDTDALTGAKSGFRGAIDAALEDAFERRSEGRRRLREEFGIDFARRPGSSGAVEVDLDALRKGLRENPEVVLEFFLGDESRTREVGLLDRLFTVLDGTESAATRQLSGTGGLLDRFA